MPAGPVLHFVHPGDLATPTGGYGYDRRLIEGLRRLGWTVNPVPLPGTYPDVDDRMLGEAGAVLDALPDGAITMVDGLAFGVMPDIARHNRDRLGLVALVYHPLADETGLEPAAAFALASSERDALASARAVVCTSRTTAARLLSGYGVKADRLHVAPPGTDPLPRATADRREPIILTLAALVPRKGHDVLLDAFAKVADRNWSARLVGSDDRDPAWAARLRSRAESLGIGARVAFAGAVADPVAELMSADIFVLATRHEGYGMAFAEALAAGLPVVGTAVGAVPEVVPPDAGLLVPPDDPDALAAALSTLLEDPGARRRKADAAFAAGRRLPRWDDTAAIVDHCLRALSR